MSVYDRLSSDKKWPPESRKNRKELQFGRYDYYVEPDASSEAHQQPKRSAAEVDAIVERLRQDLHRDDDEGKQGQQRSQHRSVTESEAKAIFDRLRQCDHARCPVESRVGRRELGQNRYDFYRGPAADPGSATPRVTKAELATIVGRLSAYDVAKTPPDSRALEIKQRTKAAGGAA